MEKRMTPSEIRKRIKEKGFTQEQFATKFGITRNHLIGIINDVERPIVWELTFRNIDNISK